MQRVRIIADDFFKKCEIKELPISISKLYEVIKANNWELRYYSWSADIINFLKLNEYAELKDGFTYADDERVIIFLKDELEYLEKTNVICHEIGHITLGHTIYDGIIGKNKSKNIESILEKEANVFSLEFQAPLFMLLRKNYDTAEKIYNAGILNKELAELQYKALLEYKDNIRFKKINKNIIIGIITVVTIIIVAVIVKENNHLKTNEVAFNNYSFIEEKAEKINSESESENDINVIVTKSGKKYHKSTCQYVKNKTNTFGLAYEDAVKAGYEPCKVCFPEKK